MLMNRSRGLLLCSQNYLIVPFWFGMVALIVFGASFMPTTISIGTLVKGTLLIVMVRRASRHPPHAPLCSPR